MEGVVIKVSGRVDREKYLDQWHLYNKIASLRRNLGQTKCKGQFLPKQPDRGWSELS